MEPIGGASESSQKFYQFFQHEVKSLQEQIDKLNDTTLSPAQRLDATDNCLSRIASLSSEVNDASAYIPAYDQRMYSQSIRALQTRLQQTRAATAPKQKFSFKNAPKTSKNQPAMNADGQTQAALVSPTSISSSSTDKTAERPLLTNVPQRHRAPPAPSNSPASTQDLNNTTISISSFKNAHITLHDYFPSPTANPNPPHHPQTATLRAISQSIVDFSPSKPPLISGPHQQQHHEQSDPPLISVTINGISSSLLLLHRVNGPIHLTAMQSSTVVASCRQFRMHDSTACDVYLACDSRPIIEGCSGVRFAPLPNLLFRSWGLGTGMPRGDEGDREAGLWDQVDDFGWLVAGTQSPNWRVLEPGERVPEGVWETLGTGDDAGGGVEDVLSTVGIKGR